MKTKILQILLILILVSPIPTGVLAAAKTRTIRLTLENKSGYDVYVYLQGQITKTEYYFQLPIVVNTTFFSTAQVIAGNKEHPLIKAFDIQPDVYFLRIDYYTNEQILHHEEVEYEIRRNYKLSFEQPVISYNCAAEWEPGESKPKDCDLLYFKEIETRNYRFYPLGYIY